MQTTTTAAQAAQDAQTPGRLSVMFLLATAFLSTLGIGIIGPVLPFIVEEYLPNATNVASVMGWLLSSYAICQFLAAPALGALSDRFGRRPLLLICLFGSAVGYLLFGWGGALWVLFLGRIIDGITGGNFSILAAYVGDVVKAQDRGRFFGFFGAATGAGFILGPVIGGFAAQWGYAAPFYLAAGVTALVWVGFYFFLPESLQAEHRSQQIGLAALNPFTQLRAVLALPNLRGLLLINFLYALPFAIVQAISALLIKDSLGWNPARIGFVYLGVGLMDIAVQGGLVNWLLPRLGEVKTTMTGILFMIGGYALFALLPLTSSAYVLIAAVLCYGLGSGLIEPALRGMLSQAAGPREQGIVQGGGQSVQSLALVVGPLIGGLLYTEWTPGAPFWFGAVVSLAALFVLRQAKLSTTNRDALDEMG